MPGKSAIAVYPCWRICHIFQRGEAERFEMRKVGANCFERILRTYARDSTIKRPALLVLAKVAASFRVGHPKPAFGALAFVMPIIHHHRRAKKITVRLRDSENARVEELRRPFAVLRPDFRRDKLAQVEVFCHFHTHKNTKKPAANAAGRFLGWG